MQKRVSIKTIAEKLGVSIALVSYVLNGKEKQARVGAEMAEKIRRTAAKLNYQPNLIARGLKYGSTRTIGLIVADISNPFFSGLARIIENEAKLRGYTVIMGSSDENLEKYSDLAANFLNRQVDGLIIVPVEHAAEQLLSLQKKKFPFVLIDRGIKDLTCSQVLIDNAGASSHAVELLVGHGYKKIGMVVYDTSLEHMKARIAGYKKALKKNHITADKQWIRKVSYAHLEEDIDIAIQSLVKEQKVDAIFFASNSIAVQSLKRINAMGVNIPSQLGVVSFDESDSFDFFYSPVTYVRQDLQKIGEQAVQLLVEHIKDANRPPSTQIIPAEIIVRESSGSKKKRRSAAVH